MAIRKSAKIRELERGLEDHERRATQAKLAGQLTRVHFHNRQVKIWRKWLARAEQEQLQPSA